MERIVFYVSNNGMRWQDTHVCAAQQQKLEFVPGMFQ